MAPCLLMKGLLSSPKSAQEAERTSGPKRSTALGRILFPEGGEWRIGWGEEGMGGLRKNGRRGIVRHDTPQQELQIRIWI